MSVRVTTLKNGLRVATDHIGTVESATVGVWCDVGTRDEPAPVNGVAHLLEHMVFKGTRRRSASAIAEEIENVGGHMNAYTAREQTAYYARVLKGDLALAVDLIADILQHSLFDPQELRRERAVVLQEIGQANDTPDDIIFDHFQAAAFPRQGVGRPVLGRASVVKRMKRDTVREFLAGHYAPGNLVLAAAGNVQHDRLVRLAEEKFDRLPKAAKQPRDTAQYRGGEHREHRALDQIHLVLGFEGLGHHDKDFYPLQVMSTVLGGGMSSRLFQEVREKRGLVYSIYSFASSMRDGGVFGIYAGTGEKEVRELLPVVAEEVVKVADKVTEEEVARARAQLKAGTLMALESTSSRCEQLAQQLIVFGRPIPTSEIVARIEAVDAGAVTRVMRRMLATPLTMAALGPIKRVDDYAAVAARLN
ncbi:MAG: insulinase family protein [Alphaproteobacteria bacterium]|nr:insulinase family protein [Alphaproteobacteria bacterium]